MLKVLSIFTLGSITGLVTFSHVLSYVLKHFRNITLSLLTGFIIGSLGVVWPWKKTIYKTAEDGTILLDSAGGKIIENYQRFFPKFDDQAYLGTAFIVLGFLIVLMLEWYGQKTIKNNA